MNQQEKVDLLILGGRLLDPGAGIVGAGDVAVRDGKILAVGKDLHSRFVHHLSVYEMHPSHYHPSM